MHFKDKRVLQIKSTDDMLRILESKGNPQSGYKKGTRIHVFNKMQKDYSYVLEENPGTNMGDFKPEISIKAAMELGIFELHYMTDQLLEFPKEWFIAAIKKGKMSPEGPDPTGNCFGVKSRLPLQEWKKKGWVPNTEGFISKMYPILSDPSKNPDKRGIFEWMVRYYLGRRIPELDEVQIKRWRAFTRHAGQIRANCKPKDESCRPVQRQALLQWLYNPFI